MTQSTNGEPQLPPGPRGRRLRNYYRRMFHYPEFVEQLEQQYGHIVYYELPMNLRCCVVFDADLAQEVLVTQVGNFPPWPPGLEEPNKLMEHGCLAVHHGEQHRWRKELMATAFTEDRLDGYAEAISRHAKQLRDRLPAGKVVDLRTEAEKYTVEAVVSAVLGQEVPSKYTLQVGKLLAIGILLDFIPLGWVVKNLGLTPPTKEIDEAIYSSIRRAREDASHPGRDLIAHLVRAKAQGLSAHEYDSDRALRDEIITYIAFFDAPTAAICLAFHHMGHNPSVRDRVEREIAEVLNGRDPEAADFHRLTYARAVFQETLRLEPQPYVTLPKGAVEDCVVGGYRIPKGTLMHVGRRAIHRRTDYWRDAEAFQPERWLEDGPACPAHASIPFGAGPHECSGPYLAEMVFVFSLAAIMQKLRIEPVSDQPPKKNNIGVGVGRFRTAVRERSADR